MVIDCTPLLLSHPKDLSFFRRTHIVYRYNVHVKVWFVTVCRSDLFHTDVYLHVYLHVYMYLEHSLTNSMA